MRDIAKSMMRFSWAATLLGAQQMANVLKPGDRRAKKVRPDEKIRPDASFDGATWTIQGRLDELLQAAFQAGDDLQTEWLDLVSDALTPARWGRVASDMADRSLEALRLAAPGDAGAAVRRELRNKYEIYWLVKGVRKVLELPPHGRSFSLLEKVARAYELDPFRALWAVEGLGHDYAATLLEDGDLETGILTDPKLELLPSASLPMLHAGLGLACAEHVLRTIAPHSPRGRIRGAIERFVSLCRENSRERHADAALEALGLVARCFFADLVPALERELEAMDEGSLRRVFWHGVGRAIYFVPANFVPGYSSTWHAVQMAKRESPDETAHHYALAGVAYAFILVNMADPGILEELLGRHGDALRGGAFVDGLVASVVMRKEITPDAPVLREFLAYRPAARLTDLWDETVRIPCQKALTQRDPARRRTLSEGEAGEIYQSLARQGVAAKEEKI
ncbi:MAG: hypothetical protein GY856_17025 [bacterium]|nr:hypothetical protein [bacterium]